MVTKPCVDCVKEGITTKRKTAAPGPRCATHKRARRSVTRDTAWERRLLALYALSAEEYLAIYNYQHKRCCICERATGTGRKRLAVDHDHSSGYVRGLLCQPCNRMLGHLRDDPEAFKRAARYLGWPPAWAVIGKRITPVTDLT